MDEGLVNVTRVRAGRRRPWEITEAVCHSRPAPLAVLIVVGVGMVPCAVKFSPRVIIHDKRTGCDHTVDKPGDIVSCCPKQHHRCHRLGDVVTNTMWVLELGKRVKCEQACCLVNDTELTFHVALMVVRGVTVTGSRVTDARVTDARECFALSFNVSIRLKLFV